MLVCPECNALLCDCSPHSPSSESSPYHSRVKLFPSVTYDPGRWEMMAQMGRHIFEEHKSEEAQCPVTYAAPIAALQWDLNHVGCSNEAGVRNYCFVVFEDLRR